MNSVRYLLSAIRLSSIIRLLPVLIITVFTPRLLSMYDNACLKQESHSEAVVSDRETIALTVTMPS